MNETVCQSNVNNGVITTGGGFSDYYSLPSWQTNIVSSYFKKVDGTSKQPYQG